MIFSWASLTRPAASLIVGCQFIVLWTSASMAAWEPDIPTTDVSCLGRAPACTGRVKLAIGVLGLSAPLTLTAEHPEISARTAIPATDCSELRIITMLILLYIVVVI